MDAFDNARAKAWSRVPTLIDDWTVKCAAPAWDIRQAVSDVYTLGDVGVYWDPHNDLAALLFRGDQSKRAQDEALIRQAVSRAVGREHVETAPLTAQHLGNYGLVKVAFSPTLRRAGELLNFFPGEYPGGYPNAPSPLAATLSGGLVGAGLGYGVGALGEKLLPNRWRKGPTRRTGAILGALLGGAPGAMGMLAHHQTGRSMLDPGPLNTPADAEPTLDPADLGISPFKQADDVLAMVPLGQRYKQAVDQFCKRAFESMGGTGSDLAVNLNRLGQVLWDVGAPPQITATTMGALYAAQQLPDENRQPGLVTQHQVGLLGTMMGAAGGGAKGYAVGWLAGKALGLLTGMPEEDQNSLKNTGAILGIVDAVVPKLFR